MNDKEEWEVMPPVKLSVPKRPWYSRAWDKGKLPATILVCCGIAAFWMYGLYKHVNKDTTEISKNKIRVVKNVTDDFQIRYTFSTLGSEYCYRNDKGRVCLETSDPCDMSVDKACISSEDFPDGLCKYSRPDDPKFFEAADKKLEELCKEIQCLDTCATWKKLQTEEGSDEIFSSKKDLRGYL